MILSLNSYTQNKSVGKIKRKEPTNNKNIKSSPQKYIVDIDFDFASKSVFFKGFWSKFPL